MRILHLYAGNLYGGIESVLLTLARDRTLCRDMEPQYALCFEGRLCDELQACGATVYYLQPTRISRPWTVWRARHALRQALNAGHFDVAVTHSAWAHCLFGPVVRSSPLPLAFWARDIHRRGQFLNWWASCVRPDVLICNSKTTERSVASSFGGLKPIVVYNPIAPAPIDKAKARREIRAEMKTSDDAVVILHASRVERWKGHELLLEALVHLTDLPDWVCWFAGGAQRPHERRFLDQLHRRCDHLGLGGRVRWSGQRRDIPALLAGADIHCQPNTSPEPFGNIFVEALYAGLPVVTTALGGPCEILTPACGELVPPNNPAKLSVALRRYIQSQNLRSQASEVGPRRAAELCDPSRQMSQLHECFCMAVKACSARTI